jgi:hypothetical protein
MALDPAVLKARIDLRICELRVLAAETSKLGAAARAGTADARSPAASYTPQ